MHHRQSATCAQFDGNVRAAQAFSATQNERHRDALDREIAHYRAKVAPTLALAAAWKEVP